MSSSATRGQLASSNALGVIRGSRPPVPTPTSRESLRMADAWKERLPSMASHRVFVPKYGAAILLALGLAVQASAATDPSSTAFAEKVKNIRIVNFGRINDNYYRGSQPRGRDFEDLAALGVKMDIDLAEEGRADEQANAERAGMKFVRIPMTTTDTPT